MLTCYDVSAIMSAINLVQIRIIIMNALKTAELILTCGHLQTLIAHCSSIVCRCLCPVFVDYNIQAMTHLIKFLIVYLQGVRENFT